MSNEQGDDGKQTGDVLLTMLVPSNPYASSDYPVRCEPR